MVEASQAAFIVFIRFNCQAILLVVSYVLVPMWIGVYGVHLELVPPVQPSDRGGLWLALICR